MGRGPAATAKTPWRVTAKDQFGPGDTPGYRLDCSELDHLSLYGLGVLVRLHKQMDEKLGEIKIASASGSIVTILRRTGLARLFKIYPDVQSAREAFKKVKKTPLILR